MWYYSLVTQRDKRVRQLFQSTRNVSFKELDSVLKGLGFEVRQPKSGSSHFVYVKGGLQMSRPFKRPFVKEIYVKRVLELLGEEK
jgi:hypothetical protein